MLYFKNRRDAGLQLSQLLMHYQDKNVIVYALPRGGVVVADEIANALHAPIDLIFAHKIGHPLQPEYAIAAVSESGHLVGTPYELAAIGKAWLDREKQHQMDEIEKKRKLYLKQKKELSLNDKIAIIVDDGVATGLTIQAGIKELREYHPKKIVAAVPVCPKSTADLLKTMVDDFVALLIPGEGQFLGSVGAYYHAFSQVEDEEVIAILNNSPYAKRAK